MHKIELNNYYFYALSITINIVQVSLHVVFLKCWDSMCVLFKFCVDLLRGLMSEEEFEVDSVMLLKLGYVQMQYGDLEGAKRTFEEVEKMVGSGNEEVGLRNLVSRNKALMHLVEKDYISAVREYDERIERDRHDVIAINNKALCLMYLRDLSDSIKVLENALERTPTVTLNETLL